MVLNGNSVFDLHDFNLHNIFRNVKRNLAVYTFTYNPSYSDMLRSSADHPQGILQQSKIYETQFNYQVD